ncbi:MAG: enoyl-CoA hydratase/isomerase family protein [Polyangiaceae bacterium]
MFEITMAGPSKNALNGEMLTFIIDQLRVAAGRPVLLTGTGNAFSAGLDLKYVASLDDSKMGAFLRLLEDCMVALYLYPGPTVALVNGHAIAGGCVLTQCCDRRVMIADPWAKMGLNEVAIGVRFPPRTLAIVRHRVPERHHEEVLLGAQLFDPQNALRLGLIDELHSAESAPPYATDVARVRLKELASSPAAAYAATKADLRGTKEALCSDEEEERRLAGMLGMWTSQVVKDKIAAVLARKGR